MASPDTGKERSDTCFAFDGVSFVIDGKPILRDLTMRVSARRIGVVGRNGSGKSTFARLFAGLVTATSGTVTVDGIDVAKDRRTALSTVGILFQNPDHQIIFPTVEEELTFGLRQQGASKAEAKSGVERILTRFGKTHWVSEATGNLSQGQKKLVCLMAVLAMRPKAIILDEPLSGLDIPTQMQLSRYLDRVDEMLLHISHDPDHLQGCDHVIWLDEGQLRREGGATDLLPAFRSHMLTLGRADALSDLAD